MSSRSWWMVTALALALLTPTLAAQSFEGVIRQRTIEVEEDLLFELMDDENEPDFDSEEEWLVYAAQRLFAIPTDRLVNQGASVMEMDTWVKGRRFRVSGWDEMGSGYMVYDGDSRTSYMVNVDERWFIRISRDDVDAATKDAERMAEEMAERMGLDLKELERQAKEAEAEEGWEDWDEEEIRTTVRDLDGTRTVAGMQASGRLAVTAEMVAQGWCADDGMGFMEAFKQLAADMGVDEDEWEEDGPAPEDLVCGDRMPLLMQVFELYGGFGGGSYTVEELVALDETPVDDDMFEIPAEFEERTLSDIWGGRDR